MRPHQKVALVLGCVWIAFIGFTFALERPMGYEGKDALTALNTTFTPVLIVWFFTGTLKHILDWFKR